MNFEDQKVAGSKKQSPPEKLPVENSDAGSENKTLEMRFDGTATDRQEFLSRIRSAVTELTGKRMTLDALIIEIAKNIFDHADGRGSLIIERKNGSFDFEIKDDGTEAYDLESCSTSSRLAGNKVNFGTGLELIQILAKSLGIKLHIDTSKGFSYSGKYTPGK